MIPSMKVNIGVDVGFGKDDYGLTFRILIAVKEIYKIDWVTFSNKKESM
jgi:hypothetical protein